MVMLLLLMMMIMLLLLMLMLMMMMVKTGVMAQGYDLHIIIFSKDRAYQLQELLHSLYDFVIYPTTTNALPPPPLHHHITILYTTTPQTTYEASYTRVSALFPQVQFIREEEGSFFDQVMSVMDRVADGDCVMWAVDDMLFYRHWDVR